MFAVELEGGGVTIIERKYLLIATADAPFRRKLFCTLYIKILYSRRA